MTSSRVRDPRRPLATRRVPDVVAQLEELPGAEILGEWRFSLPVEAARLHFPHLGA